MPVSTSAQNINTELGVSSTASVNLNATAVRNLANMVGAISFADCRWGIAVPARNVDIFVATADPAYSSTNSASISSSITVSNQPPIARAKCEVTFNSNGTLTYAATTALGSTPQNSQSFNYTWLIVGSNSDYTIRLDLTSGSVSGDSTGSDLALTSTRTWSIEQISNGSTSADGTLILKRSGTTVIARPIYMQADVTVQNP